MMSLRRNNGVAPPDRYGLVYLILVLLGCGALLPWNVFITETEYFLVRVQQPPSTPLIANYFETVLALSFQVTNAITVMALLPAQKHLSLRCQIMYPLLLELVILVGAASLANTPLLSGNVVIAITLPSVAMMGTTTACLAAGSYSLAVPFPPIYTLAIMTGMALAGLGTACWSFFSLWASPVSSITPTPSELARPALVYFAGSIFVVFLSAIGYTILPHLPFVRFYTQDHEEEVYSVSRLSDHTAVAGEVSQAGGDGETPKRPPQIRARRAGSAEVVFDDAQLQEPLLLATADPSEGSQTSPSQAGSPERSSTRIPLQRQEKVEDWSIWRMTRALSGSFVTLVACFSVSLSVFPSLTSQICSVRNPAITAPCAATTPDGRFYGDLFVPWLFILYSIGDLSGRLAANLGRSRTHPMSDAAMLTYAGLRVFIALGLLFCNIVVPHPWAIPLLLRHDAFPMILICLLGMTNGHLASIAIMHASKRLPLVVRHRCGSMLSYGITIGITSGLFMSFLIGSAFQRG